jgi:hypothetical protein
MSRAIPSVAFAPVGTKNRSWSEPARCTIFVQSAEKHALAALNKSMTYLFISIT